MKIIYTKSFEKQFIHLTTNQKERVYIAIEKFKQDPFDSPLRNHALRGKQFGFRAVSAGGDLRLVFKQLDNYSEVFFTGVGTHNQVYK